MAMIGSRVVKLLDPGSRDLQLFSEDFDAERWGRETFGFSRPDEAPPPSPGSPSSPASPADASWTPRGRRGRVSFGESPFVDAPVPARRPKRRNMLVHRREKSSEVGGKRSHAIVFCISLRELFVAKISDASESRLEDSLSAFRRICGVVRFSRDPIQLYVLLTHLDTVEHLVRAPTLAASAPFDAGTPSTEVILSFCRGRLASIYNAITDQPPGDLRIRVINLLDSTMARDCLRWILAFPDLDTLE